MAAHEYRWITFGAIDAGKKNAHAFAWKPWQENGLELPAWKNGPEIAEFSTGLFRDGWALVSQSTVQSLPHGRLIASFRRVVQ